MIAAAAALFAACAENDTFKDVDTQDAVIGLNGQYVEKQTRAEITSAWLTTANSKFGVFGYRYASGNANEITLFNNEEVTYVTTPSADWTHTTVRYWDKGASDEYYFYAYAPYSGTATFDRTSDGLTYTLPANVFLDTDDATDLCIAGAVEQTDYAECSDAHVHFTFSHVLSKLSFKVIKTGFGANESVRLTSITFAAPSVTSATWNQNGVNTTADADITYDGLTNPTSASDLTAKVAFNDSGADENGVVGVADVVVGATAANIIAGSNSFIVLPNNAPQDPTDIQADEKHLIKLAVGYELTYSDGQIEPQTAYGDVALLYEQGNHYIVTINIKPVEIQFHADVINGFNDVTVAESFDVQ